MTIPAEQPGVHGHRDAATERRNAIILLGLTALSCVLTASAIVPQLPNPWSVSAGILVILSAIGVTWVMLGPQKKRKAVIKVVLAMVVALAVLVGFAITVGACAGPPKGGVGPEAPTPTAAPAPAPTPTTNPTDEPTWVCGDRLTRFPCLYQVKEGDSLYGLATQVLLDYPSINGACQSIDDYFRRLQTINATPDPRVIHEGDRVILEEPDGSRALSVPPMTDSMFSQFLDILRRSLSGPFDPGLETWFRPLASDGAATVIMKTLVEPTGLGLTPPWRIVAMSFPFLGQVDSGTARDILAVLHIIAINDQCEGLDERIVMRADLATVGRSVVIDTIDVYRNWPQLVPPPEGSCQ